MASGVLIRIGGGIPDEPVAGRREGRLGPKRLVGGTRGRLQPPDAHEPRPESEGEHQRNEVRSVLRAKPLRRVEPVASARACSGGFDRHAFGFIQVQFRS